MKYRKLTSDGDYSFGSGGNADFLINTPEAVAQAVKTRLMFWEGEWFLNTSDGTPYETRILGKHTQTLYDSAIKERILGTQGVKSILEYNSGLDSSNRELSISVKINTIYGQATITGITL